jgi:hypothetical protein
MSVELFSNGTAFFEPDKTAGASSLSARSTLYLDGVDPVDFCLVQKSRGTQSARIQVDATIDGDLYAIGCEGGVGRYDLLFFDGLKTGNCDTIGTGLSTNDTVMAKYLKLKNIKSRRARVYIYPPNSSSKIFSTSCCGVFDGLVDAMSTQLSEDQTGNLILYVGLSVIGSWRSA